MTLQEFVTKYNGQGWDFDGYYGDQCMDLFEFYNRDVIGAPVVTGNAIDVPNTYPKNFYSWVENTPLGTPTAGDVVIWGSVIGQFGHIAIFLTGDNNNFTSLDQNWPINSLTHEQTHDYNGVLGWLHPLPPTQSSTVPVDSQTFQKLVTNSTAYDAVCDELGQSHDTGKDTIIALIKQLKLDNANQTATIANLNKQIPDLEGQISTLNNQVADITTKLEAAQNQANSGASYQGLYEQSEIKLKSTQNDLANLIQTTNRQISQLQNTSATTMPVNQLWKVFLSRVFHLS